MVILLKGNVGDTFCSRSCEKYNRENIYMLLKTITGVDKAYDLYNQIVQSATDLFLRIDPVIGKIVGKLCNVIDYLNNPKTEINEDNIRKLFNEVDRPGIIFGTAVRLEYLKVTGYLRLCGIEKLRLHLSKYGIKPKAISRIDKLENQTPIKSQIAVFIIRMEEEEFKKAFNQNIWHRGTSIQHYHPNEDTEKIFRNQCTTEYY
ncbi:hypothetical protein SNEBB_002763 [Seison nebaliae]|nr:hypothetical protein SNEBB_002763 [Seison nebaliae]